MTTTQERPTRPTYGNWILHRSPGIAGVGLIGSGVLLGGLVLVLISLMAGGLPAALVAGGFALLLFLATGPSFSRRLARRVGFRRARRAGEHQWRSGAFSKNRSAIRLPGMLGKTTLLHKTDPFGVPFAVVKTKTPRSGPLYTIVARCLAEGPSLQDQERINSWVAGFGRVLASTGQEPGLVCAKAITDTAPDPGGRLGAMVRAVRAESGPDLARQVMDECVAHYPSASSENITYIELTFRGRGLSRKGDEDAILSELSRRVPGLLGQLKEAGGGAVDMVATAELPSIVRVAYDPKSQPYLEQAELAGHEQPVAWHEAGPVSSQEAWDRLRHDSGLSVTWEMHDAPRAAITDTALTGLLMPHRDFTRKRVALIFRPHTPDQSARVAEQDAQTATFTANQNTGGRITASASLRMRATEQSRQEVASGAVMVRFSLLVTATVTDRADLDQAVSTVESRAGAVPIRLRRCYGSQAAGFATTLPVGFVPWEHTVIPDKIRELI